MMRNYDNIYYQYRTGMLDDDRWELHRADIAGLFMAPGVVAWWHATRPGRSGIDPVMAGDSKAGSSRPAAACALRSRSIHCSRTFIALNFPPSGASLRQSIARISRPGFDRRLRVRSRRLATEQPLFALYSITGGSVPEASQPVRGEKQWLPSRVFQP